MLTLFVYSFISMAAERPSLAEYRGNKLISTFRAKDIKELTGEVAYTTPFPNCNYFVTFPERLSGLFPNSYISPQSFIKELNPNEISPKRSDINSLIGEGVALDKLTPVFSQGGSKDDFTINVWNGMTNPHATKLSELATMDLAKNEEARAQYQHELFKLVKPNIEGRHIREQDTRGSIKYHDDCLATGDSIVGDWVYKIQRDPAKYAQMKEFGVDVIIDGPATAQGILFMKAFAQAHGFKLRLNVGYMGFGLSEANYITYPDEVLKMIDPKVADSLNTLRKEKHEQPQLVGDMGKAIQKVSAMTMAKMRESKGKDFNILHEWRTDNYEPDHNNPYTVDVKKYDSSLEGETIYMAKGGFYCLAADKFLDAQSPETNWTVIDAGRTQVNGFFGAAYYDLGMKPRDTHK